MTSDDRDRKIWLSLERKLKRGKRSLPNLRLFQKKLLLCMPLISACFTTGPPIEVVRQFTSGSRP